MANSIWAKGRGATSDFDSKLEQNITDDKEQQYDIDNLSSRMTLAESSVSLQNIAIAQLNTKVDSLESGGVGSGLEERILALENYLRILSSAIHLRDNENQEINFN